MTADELQINVRLYDINNLEYGCGFVLMRHKPHIFSNDQVKILDVYGVEIVGAIDVRYIDYNLVVPYAPEHFDDLIDEETYLKYMKK